MKKKFLISLLFIFNNKIVQASNFASGYENNTDSKKLFKKDK